MATTSHTAGHQAPSSEGRPAPPSNRLVAGIKVRYRDYTLVAVLLAEVVFWSIVSPVFLTEMNLLNIMRAAAAIGVMAVGMTFVVLTAGIDLSVGSAVSFVGIVTAWVLGAFNNIVVAFVVALGVGALVGLFNGFFIAKLNVPPFIVTLALLNVLIACAQLWNNGGPLPVSNPQIQLFGSGYFGPVPIPVVVCIATFIVGWWLLSQTRFGRHVYAVGDDPRTARLSGIRVERILISVYLISGTMVGLATLMYLGRLGTASPLTGVGLELQVIAAVIVGGCSLFGGYGNLRDTLVGVLILAVLANGLTLVGVSGFWQTLATGLALLLAVLFSPVVSIQQRIKILFTKAV